MYYMRARWFEPSTGRFLSEDPLAGGLNRYLYSGNDPINGQDPTGLCPAGSELWALFWDNDGDGKLSDGDEGIMYYCSGGTSHGRGGTTADSGPSPQKAYPLQWSMTTPG